MNKHSAGELPDLGQGHIPMGRLIKKWPLRKPGDLNHPRRVIDLTAFGKRVQYKRTSQFGSGRVPVFGCSIELIRTETQRGEGEIQ